MSKVIIGPWTPKLRKAEFEVTPDRSLAKLAAGEPICCESVATLKHLGYRVFSDPHLADSGQARSPAPKAAI